MSDDCSSFSAPDLPPPTDQSAAGSLYNTSVSGLDSLLTSEAINDIGNARIFTAIYGRELAFTPEWGEGWMFYNGKLWEVGDHKAMAAAMEVISLRVEAFHKLAASDKNVEAKVFARLDKLSTAARLKGILELAKSSLHVPARAYDADPHLFNATNGTIDLHSGTLLPHVPEHYITKMSPVEYIPDAHSPLWLETLDIITCHDVELADFIQLLAGSAVSGDTKLQHFFYLLGEGKNGKSLLTGLWEAVLGGFESTGYAVRIPNETILNKASRTAGSTSSDVMALKGKRLALLSEQEPDIPLNTSRIKEFTGGDSLSAREPNCKQMTFKPSHTLICAGNHIPPVNASDYGFWRRFLVVPFKGSFNSSPIVKELGELHTPKHLSAIMTWMVAGAVRLDKGEWNIPTAVEIASRACQMDGDVLNQWIAECCETGTGKEWTTTLYESYCSWCKERNEYYTSHSMFTRRMQQLHFQKHSSNSKSWLLGIRLLPSCSESDGLECPTS